MRFTIIIPVYNRAHIMSRAIDSVLNQTFEDFELLIVDDCSTDNISEVIGKYSDKRIKYIQSDSNQGAAAARNRGIEVSKGEYISLLDSDDFYEPDFLEETLKTLAKTPDNVGFMWTGLRMFAKGFSKEQFWQPSYQKKRLLYVS